VLELWQELRYIRKETVLGKSFFGAVVIVSTVGVDEERVKNYVK
jgi:hypothetical protein